MGLEGGTVTPYLTQCKLTPYKHQVEGINALIEHSYFLLADEMGAGKTLQTIVAAQILFFENVMDRVIVIAPASVRLGWYDPELGELRKHLWDTTPAQVFEFHARIRQWVSGPERPNPRPANVRTMQWFITNYDFIRSKPRLDQLMGFVSQRTLLILDESSAVKNPQAMQTKACLALRKFCGRVWLLNGTPIANHPGDLFSQSNIMRPVQAHNNWGILGCKNYFHFRARYAIMGGFQQKQIIGWRDLDDLQRRMAPFVLRRLKSECLDLPPKLPPVQIYVPLTETTWKHYYTPMKEDLIAWFSSSEASMAPQAITKVLRLAQITSGFLGGVAELSMGADLLTDLVDTTKVPEGEVDESGVAEIGREKLDAFLSWYEQRREEDPQLKLLVFSRFRPELLRLQDELEEEDTVHVGMIIGGQKRDERERAIRLLDPRTMPSGPVVVLCSEGAGSIGLNLTGAHTVMRLSRGFSLFKMLQGDDRVHRPGQTHAVSYFNLVATGPKGQKTIDHATIAALMKKLDLATMTTAAWVKTLREE